MGHTARQKRFGRPTGRHSFVNKRLRLRNHMLNVSERKKTLLKSFFSCHSQNDNGLCTVVLRKVCEPNTINRDGYRVINLNLLNMFMIEVTRHMLTCSKAQYRVQHGQDTFKLVGSTRTSGVACILTSYCLACAHRFTLDTSSKISLNGSQHYDINVRAVWGQMSSGGGCSKMNEVLNTMGMPGMSQPQFTKIEHSIGEKWGEKANEEMLFAAAEEKSHAIETGSFHEGVPAVTVVCDGGWSKRSHKHTYNALGGVGVIIGVHTKKLLHVGVRTKTCAVCTQAETKGVHAPEHTCFKNWKASSQAMEADIILDGFNACEGKFGLRYTRVIADGDSSTLSTLQQHGPPWCRAIEKVECANHSLKCLRGHLEKLVESKPHYKGKSRLTKQCRERICSFIRHAIRLRSLSPDASDAVRLLKQDILHSLNHTFGVHLQCHSDICFYKKGGSNTEDSSTAVQVPLDSKDSDVLETVDSNISAWKAATSTADDDVAARGGRPGGAINVDGEMRQDVMLLLNRVAKKADKLVGNFTTNLAESWMSLRGKFDGGKYVDRCKRGSWQARCYGATLRKNLGPDWSAKVWEEVTETSATPAFHVLGSRVTKARAATVRSSGQAAVRKRRWLRKRARDKQNCTTVAKRSYGPQVLDDSDDLSSAELRQHTESFYASKVCLSKTQCEVLERDTRGQAENDRWQEERHVRITASNFGLILSKKPSTKLSPTIERLLYGRFQGNASTRFGLQQERATFQEYELQQSHLGNVTVVPCGLFVSPEHPFLGASPDGVVHLNGVPQGLIEVKNVLKDKPVILEEAAANSSFCLKKDGGHLHIRQSHQYFYQCLGQLHISGMPWLDFVVRAQNPYQLFIQRILPDTSMWIERMVPKLRHFYFKALLPELAVPRFRTVTGIREPGTSWNDSDEGSSFSPAHGAPLPSQHSTSDPPLNQRPRRLAAQKFVGRRIAHKWIMDEESDRCEWFEGSVLRLLSGRDGQPGAVHEVAYDGEDDLHEVDHLLEDFRENSLTLL